MNYSLYLVWSFATVAWASTTSCIRRTTKVRGHRLKNQWLNHLIPSLLNICHNLPLSTLSWAFLESIHAANIVFPDMALICPSSITDSTWPLYPLPFPNPSYSLACSCFSFTICVILCCTVLCIALYTTDNNAMLWTLSSMQAALLFSGMGTMTLFHHFDGVIHFLQYKLNRLDQKSVSTSQHTNSVL